MSLKSYFYPQLISKNRSEGNLIKVIERFGSLHLTINGRPQTNPQYRANWRKLLTQCVQPASLTVSNILVLGLGGGDVIRVAQILWPAAHITAIEIDQEVIEVAKNYFDLRNTKSLKIICENAMDFLDKNRDKFDVVIVDLYEGDVVPSFVDSDIFISKIIESTNKNGFAVFNFASYTFKEKTYKKFWQKLNSYYTYVILKKYWGHNYYVAHN